MSKFRIALPLLLALAAPHAFAVDALVKSVPVPDLSKLPSDKAAEVRDARVAFEKDKPALVGDDLAQAHAVLGAVYARAGLYDAAAVAFEDAALLEPGDARWIYSQGLIARFQKQNDLALGYFEKALGLDKEFVPIRIAVVNARMERGDLDGARKILTDYTAAGKKDPVVYSLLGEIALRQKRYAEAIDATQRALAIDPKATRLYAQLADAYTGAGNAKAAADARAKAGNGVPALGDPILLGLLQSTGEASGEDKKPAASQATPLDEAAVLFAARQYAGARSKLDGVLKASPRDARALVLYARIEAASGNVAQAKTRAEAAASADPKSEAAQLVLGAVSEMSNDERGAQAAYERAAALAPRSAAAEIALGNMAMRGGRYDDAASRYRTAAQADPASVDAWSRLVAAEVAGGKCADAIREINAALAKDSRNGNLMQLFVRLTSTCPSTSAEERRMALDYGREIYRDSSAAPIGEAYALALAANGKWDDAVKTQQAAMFVLVRNGRRGEVPAYREFLQQFQAHKLPDRPWPPSSELLRPKRPGPEPAQPAK
ncbi:MAG TPA: tetratricopeptide repeat protein [Rhodanobacteraceae bacterium]|nr:tetratricopeptide repeat protein [Rhodanobacteraceae bacterium]